jgi:hypothetical protein
VRLAALFGITVTGMVYSTVLAKVHEPQGWQETSTINVFHYIVPIMMVLGWLLFGPRRRIEPRTIARAILWPVAWAVYVLNYGAVTKWYPYPRHRHRRRTKPLPTARLRRPDGVVDGLLTGT